MACNKKSMTMKRVAFRRKLRILKNLVNSTSETKSGVIMDAFMYISALKLKIEARKKEKMNQINHAINQLPLLNLNIEKVEKNEIRVTIIIEKGKDNYLGHILEAFEEMEIDVIQARVSCNNTHFVMESIAEVTHTGTNNNVEGQKIDESVLREAILKAIGRNYMY